MAGFAEEYLVAAHLDTLHTIVRPVADRWYAFGEALNVDRKILDGLKFNNMSNKTELLLVLNHYLVGENATKREVVVALRTVGCPNLAALLENRQFGVSTSGGTYYDPARLPDDLPHVDSELVEYPPKCPDGPKPLVARKLKHPRGLAIVKGETQIFIADRGIERQQTCVMVLNMGIGESMTYIVRDPYGIALDEDGNIYATDCRSHRLYKFDKQLQHLKNIGSRKDEFCYPHGIGVIAGLVYVCDNARCRIKVYDRELTFKYSFGDRERDQPCEAQILYGPIDIASDDMGGIYVADNKKKAVVKFCLREGGPPIFERHIGYDVLEMPAGLTVDSKNYIYVTDRLRNCIFVFSPTGRLVTELFKDIMQAPRGICCVKGQMDASTLYVSDVNSDVNVWKCAIQYS